MAKQIRNVSPGVRFVNARNSTVKDGEPQLVPIPPGRTVEVDVLDENDPVYKGLVECGDLDVDGGRTKQISALQDEKKRIEEELKEAHAKIAAQEDDAHAKRVAADPNQVERRQLAMAAGNPPEKADEIMADKTAVDSRGDLGRKPAAPPPPPPPSRGRG